MRNVKSNVQSGVVLYEKYSVSTAVSRRTRNSRQFFSSADCVRKKLENSLTVSLYRDAAEVEYRSAKNEDMILGTVQYITGPLMGKVVSLKSSLTSIGKGDDCKIKVKGMLVAKQAAVITRRPTGYHIAYLDGMSKPKVNGETLSNAPRTLKDGDIIELSDTKLEFFIKT